MSRCGARPWADGWVLRGRTKDPDATSCSGVAATLLASEQEAEEAERAAPAGAVKITAKGVPPYTRGNQIGATAMLYEYPGLWGGRHWSSVPSWRTLPAPA